MKKIVAAMMLAAIFLFACSKKQSPTVPSDLTNNPTPIASFTDLASVPGGTFTQIDAYNTTNAYTSAVSSFKMAKYHVTYDLWYTVYQWAVANGYSFQNMGEEGTSGTVGAAPTTAKYQPATRMNWRDAIVWCNAFSQKTGLSPVYCSDSGFTMPIKSSLNGAYAGNVNTTAGSFDNPYVRWNSNGYRLPTEGEYQCAASYIDGTNWTPYNYASGATTDYTNEAATDLVGWDSVNSGAITKAVGSLAANTLGLYDMSGNAWEWCWDWYDVYPATAQTNYRGSASGSGRVTRGGGYNSPAESLQVGYRNDSPSYAAYYDGGFRVARSN